MRQDSPLVTNRYVRFAAPLEACSEGRLIFTSAITDFSIAANAQPLEFYSAHFVEQIPFVCVQSGVVAIHYRPSFAQAYSTSRLQPMAKLALNPAIPWELEFRAAISNLDAELRSLNICAIDMADVHRACFFLSYPDRISYLYCSGNVNGLTILRPRGVALRLHIAGKARQLWLDGKSIALMANGCLWQSENYVNNEHVFDVDIAGNVCDLHISYHDEVKQSDSLVR